jgi:hypothetical protein
MAQTQEATARPLAPSPGVARLAGLVTLVNVPIHVAWAAGATFLLPGGAGVAALSQTRVANAVVSAVLVIGAGVLFAIAGPWSRPEPDAGVLRGGGRVLPAVVLTAIGAGAVVCVSHGLFGLVTKALYLAGLDTVRFPDLVRTAADRHTAAVLDVAVFEPWFLLEGVLLVLAGRQYLRTARGRRRWTTLMVAGALLVLLFGVVLTATGRRVAVG